MGVSFSWLRNVVRAGKAGIHNAAPLVRPTFLYGENQVLPVGIDHHVKVVVFETRTHAESRQGTASPGKGPLRAVVPYHWTSSRQ